MVQLLVRRKRRRRRRRRRRREKKRPTENGATNQLLIHTDIKTSTHTQHKKCKLTCKRDDNKAGRVEFVEGDVGSGGHNTAADKDINHGGNRFNNDSLPF